MSEIFLTPAADRQLKKLLRSSPKLTSKLEKTLRLLQKDLKHPSLRLHRLSGLSTWSVSIDRKTRIIFSLTSDRIDILKIGSHDQVY